MTEEQESTSSGRPRDDAALVVLDRSPGGGAVAPSASKPGAMAKLADTMSRTVLGVQHERQVAAMQLAYALAEKEYRAAADLGAVNEHVSKRLAECNMKLGNSEEAERWYAIVVKFLNREPRDLYAYAQALKSNGKYDQAEEWMDRYLATRPPEGGAQRSNITSFARKFTDQQERFTITPLTINTPYSDMAATWCGPDQVIFSSSRNEKVGIQRRAAWNDQPFLDLYRAARQADGTLGAPSLLEGKVNSALHDGPAVCSTDGSTMYFTRNSSVRGRNGITRLGIYRFIFIHPNGGSIFRISFVV